MLGVKSPIKADILFTAYYVPLVTRLSSGSLIRTTDLVGERRKLFVSGKNFRILEIEGSGSVITKDGSHKYGYRERRGVWREMPPGGLAMGNRQNCLAAVRHVAADQKLYPYGSLVYVEAAKGHKFANGPEMDGYFWVGDVGGRIHGNHFDLFVGEANAYFSFLHGPKRKKYYKTVIYKIPRAIEGLNPRHYSGLKALLAKMDFVQKEQPERVDVFDALVRFQQAHPYIPEAEYGDPDAAITLWFLTQEGYKLKQDRALSKLE
jgi:3D (Asp-Asp-Asp) domain-containing protein